MARFTLLTTAALAAIALASPAMAQDDGGRGRHGGWNRDGNAQTQQAAPERQWRGDGGGNRGGEQRAQARAEWQARAQAQQAQQQQVPQAAPQQRNAPEGGWRSQRAEGGQRYGRDWRNGGEVNRPAPAWRGATPAAPTQGVSDQSRAARWGDRNRTYSDPNRTSTYRDGYRDGRTADNWRDRAQQQDAYRDGYRQGRTQDSYRDRRDQRDAYRNGYSSGSRYSGSYNRWNRNDWRRDSRYNWYGYRNQNRDLYRAGRYYSPYRNWSYSRLSIGFFLQPLFYGQNYWIDDPWQYRLPEAYGPYRWVRYYDDALLVDIYTGEVVDVINDFFW